MAFGDINLRSFFAFTKKTGNVGVGTRDLGFLRSQTIPIDSNYLGPQWNPRRQLLPLGNPGFMKLDQTVVGVGLRGAGLAVSGQYALQPLANIQGQSK